MIDLRLGDCLEVMKDIPDGSVDAIITDPPYGTTACKWDSVIDFDLMWEQLNRIIKPNGAIVLFSSQPFTSALIMSNPKNFKYEWVWQKHKATGHLNAKKMPMKIHENICIFYKKPPTYNPQMKDGETYKPRGSHNKSLDGMVYNGGKGLRVGYSSNHDPSKRYPLTIQRFSNHNQKKDRLHPTQKPIDLMEYLINTYTNENETVLDFTMGSGSTGVAAKNLNRSFIGIEQDDKYFNIAEQRIKETEFKLF